MNGSIRIVGALLIGAAVVGTAFSLKPEKEIGQMGSIAANEAPVRTYIPTSDSDNDGIRDWEESLSDARVRDLPQETASSAEIYEAPDTLTEEFAQSFFEGYVEGALSGRINEGNQDAFLDASIASLEEKSKDVLYTYDDILISNNDFASIRNYGNAIAEIVLAHEIDNNNGAAILQNALEVNDPNLLNAIEPITDMYDHLLEHMLETPVPADMRKEHLDLVNIYHALSADVTAFRNAYDDPMLAVLRLKRYQDDALALLITYRNVYERLSEVGIEYGNDEPGQHLIQVLETDITP